MPGKARTYDLVIGLSFMHPPLPNIEKDRCPWHHTVGLVFSGSPTHLTNSLPTAQAPGGLIFYMGCPHPLCSLGITISGSTDAITGGKGTFRVGDIGLQMGLTPCGVNIAVMGSPNSRANG